MLSFYPISVAYLIAAAALFALAAWSVSSYNRSKSPLTKYLAISGLLAGAYFLVNSVPFILTSDINSLKIIVGIGSVAYYAVLVVQAKLLWYLLFGDKRDYRWLYSPVLILAIIAYFISLNASWQLQPTLSSGALNYNWPPILLLLDAVLDLLFIGVGVCVLRLGNSAKNFRGKVRIFSLSLAYIAGGILGVYNALFQNGPNNSPSMFLIYALVFGLLLVVSLIGRFQAGEQ